MNFVYPLTKDKEIYYLLFFKNTNILIKLKQVLTHLIFMLSI